MTTTPDQRLVLLDGYGIIYRAFFAQKDHPLSVRRTGELTGAVFGFANTLLKVITDLKPTHIAVTMDKAPTHRIAADSNYKAHRPSMPDELRSQIKRVRQMIEAFNIPIYECEGYEADDMLGTLAKQAAEQQVETYLVTLDSDIVQLVNPPFVKVWMFRPYQRDVVIYDSPESVKDRYGVNPDQIADLKALKGDTSDNIPGVPGIGEKTAVKLLTAFPHIETMYEYITQVTPQKMQDALRNLEEQVRRAKWMATIETACPVELDLDKCRTHDFERNKVVELFNELEFRSLIPRLPEVEAVLDDEAPPPPPAEVHPVTYHTVTTEAELDEVVRRITAAGRLALDTETTSTTAMRAKLVGISLAVEPYEAWYIPVGHRAEGDATPQLPVATVIDRLRPLFGDTAIAKTGHNLKYDMTVLANAGAPVEGVEDDTMIGAYLLGESNAGLKALAFSELGVEMTPITELLGTGRNQITMDLVPVEKASMYAAADADLSLRLCTALQPKLKEAGQWDLYRNIEVPLIPILTRMERRGVALDTDALREMSVYLTEEIKRLETALHETVGHAFNLNSPKQLSTILFEELNLPKTRKTAQGYSTDAQAMEFLRGTHPVVDLLFEYRALAKLKSTYVDTLPGLIIPETGRIHTTYNQARAATGRLSSEDPNLQNIPTRTELGRRVRRAFVARGDGDTRDERWLLLGADYSQVELRILAHITREPFLIDAFSRDEDIHRATAAQLFNVAPEQVTGDQRAKAKMVNFATIYGQSAMGLSQRSDFTRAEAVEFQRAYFAKLPGVKAYIDSTIADVRMKGYAETLMGRRRYLPEITSANGNLRAAAERMAINAPIQGTNSDIIKIAMINLQAAMDAAKLRSHMILQVHDELVFECPESEVGIVRDLACEIMPAALKLDVPLKVETKLGANWGDMVAHE